MTDYKEYTMEMLSKQITEKAQARTYKKFKKMYPELIVKRFCECSIQESIDGDFVYHQLKLENGSIEVSKQLIDEFKFLVFAEIINVINDLIGE